VTATQSDEDKPVFLLLVFWIIEEARIQIAEGALRFFKTTLHAWSDCSYFSSRPTQSGASLDIT